MLVSLRGSEASGRSSNSHKMAARRTASGKMSATRALAPRAP